MTTPHKLHPRTRSNPNEISRADYGPIVQKRCVHLLYAI